MRILLSMLIGLIPTAFVGLAHSPVAEAAAPLLAIAVCGAIVASMHRLWYGPRADVA